MTGTSRSRCRGAGPTLTGASSPWLGSGIDRGRGWNAGRREQVRVKNRWLVTGGAGYIGAHTVRQMLDAGFDVEVLDDFSTGKRERLPEDVTVHQGDLLDEVAVAEALDRCAPEGVIHLAGKKQARESRDVPLEYWAVNLMGTVSLLEAMTRLEIGNLLFSSSCAVYGSQAGVDEESIVSPESPYGGSKAAAEMVITDVARTGSLRAVNLRYFNVIGCADFRGAHDVASQSVLPRMISAAMSGDPLPVLGTDRPTPDGSCLRDYLDVRDIAQAHVVIAQALMSGEQVPGVLNASSGQPVSVLEIARVTNRAVGRPEDALELLPSHPADPSEIWAARSPRMEQMGWAPKYSLEESITSHVQALT